MEDVQRLVENPKLLKETITDPPSGRWDWNDDTQSLEFTCFSSSAEIKKKKKQTTYTYQEYFKKHLDRISQSKPSARGGQCGLRKTVGAAELNAYRAAVKNSQRNSVSLDHIKQVAISLIQENEAFPIPLCFLTIIKSGEMDDFLASLLLYLSCFLERNALEEHLESLMAEQSVTDTEVMAKTSVKVELAKKHLAYSYSRLVLGLGLPQHHHMACGRRRVSAVCRDRQLFECLYSFFSYVAWVTFGRKDLNEIQTEIGHLFRSDTFNPVQRDEEEESEEEEEDMFQIEGLSEPKQQSTAPAKRSSQRRPAWSSILTQCSPLIVSLLPSPKDQAPHLFKRSCYQKQQPARLRKPGDLMEELNQQLASLSFGILGKPLSQFSYTTLMPAKDEGEDGDNEDSHDEEENENNDTRARVTESKIFFKGQRSARTTGGKRSSLSRAYTMASRATTEVLSSDTE
ncbi:protein phosphatase 1 regulatory subunit 36 isoform X1 [Astyanax mexicanus]|uniref:Protein phosphatase 1 regulatory subunit 36 isoform X1 n=2 Tax=Astyanax mexicanus TaxID=7994 RepID=A0A8B9HTI5_ASTMX|nr:protein phosphatase 1 regulatory subunit 36 isoform X1 [Astyanax mexicanus]